MYTDAISSPREETITNFGRHTTLEEANVKMIILKRSDQSRRKGSEDHEDTDGRYPTIVVHREDTTWDFVERILGKIIFFLQNERRGNVDDSTLRK